MRTNISKNLIMHASPPPYLKSGEPDYAARLHTINDYMRARLVERIISLSI